MSMVSALIFSIDDHLFLFLTFDASQQRNFQKLQLHPGSLFEEVHVLNSDEKLVAVVNHCAILNASADEVDNFFAFSWGVDTTRQAQRRSCAKATSLNELKLKIEEVKWNSGLLVVDGASVAHAAAPLEDDESEEG